MRYIAIVSVFTFWAIFLTGQGAGARPVSYPDAWTLMVRNDGDQNSIHAHYTFDTRHSLGLRLRYDRDGDFLFTGAQLNRLLKRWNKPASQANVYARIGVGGIIDQSNITDRATDVGIMAGLSADWETRRYFVSATAEHWDAGDFGAETAYHSRVGIAPYIANTGSLHTWLMMETHHRPSAENEWGASAIARFFKGPSLLEIGVDDQGQPLPNYIHRY